MKIKAVVLFVALCVLCSSGFCDPMGYLETFDSGNMSWRTDDATNTTLFSGTDPVSWDSGIQSVYAAYPVEGQTRVIYADATSSSPAGILAGNLDYTNVPGLSVWLKRSPGQDIPSVTFFIATNNNTGSSTLSTTSTIWYYNVGVLPGTDWTQLTCPLSEASWTKARRTATFAQALADVDAIGVMYWDAGATQYNLYVDNFAVAPEPATLLIMGPAAAFLAARIRKKKAVSATRLGRMR